MLDWTINQMKLYQSILDQSQKWTMTVVEQTAAVIDAVDEMADSISESSEVKLFSELVQAIAVKNAEVAELLSEYAKSGLERLKQST